MKIIRKGDIEYESARLNRVFNHKRPERYPDAVFFPENEKDVIKAVKYAKENNYKIATRSGGHSWAVWSVRDKGILMDLQHLNHLSYNEDTQIASAGPSVKGGAELNPFLIKKGRFFNGGHCPTVGIGGFLLQGGQGWNARGWGWSAEYIESMDVITADGVKLTLSENENSDLFWAARGSGPGFFAIVTNFNLKTKPYPKALTASTYVFPKTYNKQILEWLQLMHHSVKNTVEIVAVGRLFDFGEGLVIHALAFEDTIEEAKNALAPFEKNPFLDKAILHKPFDPTHLEEECRVQLEMNPEGHRWTVNNVWLQGSPEEVSSSIVDSFQNLPSKEAFTLWFSMAPLRPLPDMAFSMQTDIYMSLYCVWKNEEDDQKCSDWVSEQMRRIEPVTAGQYLGDSDLTKHQRQFMSVENHKKLETIRKKYDPQNRFHSYMTKKEATLNQNISD